MEHFKLFIDGKFCSGSAGTIVESLDPSNNEPWATFDCANSDDVERAVAAAQRALLNPSWQKMTQTNRGKLLYRLAELIEENAETLGRIETRDSGQAMAAPSGQRASLPVFRRERWWGRRHASSQGVRSHGETSPTGASRGRGLGGRVRLPEGAHRKGPRG